MNEVLSCQVKIGLNYQVKAKVCGNCEHQDTAADGNGGQKIVCGLFKSTLGLFKIDSLESTCKAHKPMRIPT